MNAKLAGGAPRAAIIQFPGVNCEYESARALATAGAAPTILRWNEAPERLPDFDLFLLPGGFSYQDRIRAGAVAAKERVLDALFDQASAGKPVLGICNGAQVLVEAGLVPGDGAVELSLARNRMPDRAGYYARWVYVRVDASPCVFTRHLPPGTVLPLPIAHGEGRFTGGDPGRMATLAARGQVPLVYATADGATAAGFPDNPNGAERDAAAVCNARGNVLAVMPHPERAQDLGGIARGIGGPWGERRDRALAHGERDGAGPGLLLFEGLRRALEAR